jgi:hypothetical protein
METRVNRNEADGQVELLREAMTGTTTRRALLRWGLKAGLGFGALAGLMVTRGAEKASAEHSEFTDCLIVKDYDCVADCQAALTACGRTSRRSVCESQYTTCTGTCYYNHCSPNNDAGEGVLT